MHIPARIFSNHNGKEIFKDSTREELFKIYQSEIQIGSHLLRNHGRIKFEDSDIFFLIGLGEGENNEVHLIQAEPALNEIWVP